MRQCEPVIVVGASGFGRETLDVLEAIAFRRKCLEIMGVVDDAPSEVNLERLRQRGTPYLGSLNEWMNSDLVGAKFVVGVGSPTVRCDIALRLENAGFSAFTAVHPQSIIGSNTVVGRGSVICAGAIISTNVRFGRHVHINPGAIVGHDAILDDFVSINPGAVVSGEVLVNSEVLIGATATVLQQLEIGEKTIVGAASLITKNVPSNVVVKGVPGAW